MPILEMLGRRGDWKACSRSSCGHARPNRRGHPSSGAYSNARRPGEDTDSSLTRSLLPFAIALLLAQAVAAAFVSSEATASSFSPNVKINDEVIVSGEDFPTALAKEDGSVFAAWQDRRNPEGINTNPDIYFSKSQDRGETWSAPSTRVNDDTTTSFQLQPKILLDFSGTLHAAWYDRRSGSEEVYAAKSTDGGATWATNVRVGDATNNLGLGFAIDSSGALYLAWQGADASFFQHVFVSRSEDGGETWSSGSQVTYYSAYYGGDQKVRGLGAGPEGQVYILWEDWRDDANGDVFFARSADRGVTWSANVKINDDLGSAVQAYSNLAVGPSGELFCVWHDSRGSASERQLYLSKSTDGGVSWSANSRIEVYATHSWFLYPRIAVDAGGRPHLTWSDNRTGAFDLYYSRSVDSGTTWEPSLRVTDTSNDNPQYESVLTLDPLGNAYAIWFDDRDGDRDIYISRLDAKPNPGPEITLVQPASGSVVRPGVVLDFEVSDTDLTEFRVVVNGTATYVLAPPYDLDTTGWGDGLRALWAEATDAVGNITREEYSVTIDSIPPAIALRSPDDGSVVNAQVTLDFGVDDANPLSAWVVVESVGTLPLAPPFDLPVTGIPDGSRGFEVGAQDTAGNEASRTFTFTVDTSPPVIVERSPEFDRASSQPVVFVRFSEPVDTASVEDAFSLSASGRTYGTSDGVFEWAADNSSFTFSLHASLGEGVSVQVRIRNSLVDLAGNTMDQDAVWTFRTAPRVNRGGQSDTSMVLILALVSGLLAMAVLVWRRRRTRSRT